MNIFKKVVKDSNEYTSRLPATLFLNRDVQLFHENRFKRRTSIKNRAMQSNDFQKLNGFIAKLTQAATKGMKRGNSFRKMQLQSGVEMTKNTGITVSFETNRHKTTNND